MHIAIIGSGLGYKVAKKLALNGNFEVTLIEKSNLGGSFENVFSQFYYANKNLQKIKDIPFKVSFKTEDLFNKSKKNFHLDKINLLQGECRFLNQNTLLVNGKKIFPDKIIIAVGSTYKKKYIESSSVEDLLKKKYKNVTLIGGNNKVTEISFFLKNTGSKVTIICDKFLPEIDDRIRHKIKCSLKGVNILEYTKISKISKSKSSYTIYSNRDKIETEIILDLSKKIPNTHNLSLHNTKIAISQDNYIKVNKFLETSQKNVYSIGSCTKQESNTNNLILVDYLTNNLISRRKKVKNLPEILTINIFPEITIWDSTVKIHDEFKEFNEDECEIKIFFSNSLVTKIEIIGKNTLIKLKHLLNQFETIL